MYGFRSGYSSRLKWSLGTFRTIALFALFLLLINPKITTVEYNQVRPELNVLVDNSSSMTYLGQGQTTRDLLDRLLEDEGLLERFELNTYSFSEELRPLDSLDFSGTQSNIASAVEDGSDLFSESNAVTLLVTDGNQTIGNDYSFLSGLNSAVFPIAIGDTLKESDVRVARVNANRYAYLKNQFPVEVTVNYQGSDEVTLALRVSREGQQLHSSSLVFGPDRSSRTLEILLEADRLGVSTYSVAIESLEGEKNTANNLKPFAVEIIDERTDVAIVSTMVHPDIGMWKKAIEANEQRTATILEPADALERLGDFELLLLYQPDSSFSSLYEAARASNSGMLWVTGIATDWNYVNQAQELFQKEYTAQDEQVVGIVNPSYSSFAIEDPGFADFPPLFTGLGDLYIPQAHQVALRQQIDGYDTGNALLATLEVNGVRHALLDGEGMWRWRARSYVDNGSFESFDTFIGQLVQYLASSDRKQRLDVRTESFYYANNAAVLTAQYFDENYVFDPRASLQCVVTDNNTGEQRVLPMILKNNYYGLQLDGLPAGSYSYTVSVVDQNISSSGKFELVAFDVEQQFLNPDVTRLGQLATNTNGRLFFPDQVDELITTLLGDEQLLPVQQKDEKSVPLIDWIYLLGLIALALSAEWFTRKYNGLI